MIITKKAIPRRTVLRGLGAAVALPLLDGMVPAYAALRHTAAKPTRRLGVVYVPHGAVMDSWTPAAEGADFEFTPILAPLAPFRDRLLVLTGLDNQPALALKGEPAGGHGPAWFDNLPAEMVRMLEQGAKVEFLPLPGGAVKSISAKNLLETVAQEYGIDLDIPFTFVPGGIVLISQPR